MTKAQPEPQPPKAGDFRSKQLVWWDDVNRQAHEGPRAAWVIDVNTKNDTVLVGFYKDPTALREEAVSVVSPREIRPRQRREGAHE